MATVSVDVDVVHGWLTDLATARSWYTGNKAAWFHSLMQRIADATGVSYDDVVAAHEESLPLVTPDPAVQTAVATG